MVATPAPTDVIGMAIVEVGPLLTGKLSVAGTVATAVLLEESVIGTPLEPVGTGLWMMRVRNTCWPLPTMVAVGELQEMVAPT
jgi:hypothetical protein